ncbi:hypothetical protein LOK49_LG02G01624 [Camellia lanceoleosa]|uniref:Uncharacterized protein n=1 Tax=Camellia lanceoleosa TaxID=1840588 RepID=A0ACC0IS75_9ERIC|nr:hypothetical protein LOK49_LG02G01624 [Camellia lanceoleosa]
MKIFYTFLILFLLLISSVHDAHAIRLPEDTCHKLIDSSKCELQKCSQDCSKEPYGLGKYRAGDASHTFVRRHNLPARLWLIDVLFRQNIISFGMQPLAAYVDPTGVGDDVPMTDLAPGPATPSLVDPLALIFMIRANYEAFHHEHIHL